MNNIIKIYEEPWNYSLYKISNDYIITIEFYEQAIDFNLSYSLTKDEIGHIYDQQFIKNLVSTIRKNKEAYTVRNVKNPDFI